MCIISTVRLVALINIAGQQAYDATYTSARMIYWTTVEVNAAISCACIMTLKPLIQRVFPRLLSPSKCVREPDLQWITPVNNDSICTEHGGDGGDHHHHHHPQQQRLTFPITPTSPARAASRHSTASNHTIPSTAKNRRSGSLPYVHEYEGHPFHNNPQQQDTIERSRYYHSFTTNTTTTTTSGGSGSGSGVSLEYDLDHDLDLEAQRTCSGGRGGGASSVEDNHDDDRPLDPGSGAGGGIVAGAAAGASQAVAAGGGGGRRSGGQVAVFAGEAEESAAASGGQ